VVNTGRPETHRTDSCLTILPVALSGRGAVTLFLLSSGWHLISNLSPSIKQRTCRLLRH
jgi:hypothetical protein